MQFEGPLPLSENATQQEIIEQLYKARSLQFKEEILGLYIFDTKPGIHLMVALAEAYSLVAAYKINIEFTHNTLQFNITHVQV